MTKSSTDRWFSLHSGESRPCTTPGVNESTLYRGCFRLHPLGLPGRDASPPDGDADASDASDADGDATASRAPREAEGQRLGANGRPLSEGE